MRKTFIPSLIVLMSIIGLCGCSPYSSNFTCPKTENGICASVADAHVEALHPHSSDYEDTGDENTEGRGANQITWQGEMQKKINKLLREPNTPIVVQPTVTRILMLAYRGEQNELFMPRLVYMFMDEPRWVIGDYLFTPKLP